MDALAGYSSSDDESMVPGLANTAASYATVQDILAPPPAKPKPEPSPRLPVKSLPRDDDDDAEQGGAVQGPMPLHAPSTAEAETSASDRSTFKKPKKKKKKKKKKSKRNAVMVGGGRVGDIQLPDFDAVASAVSGTRVDEKFEDSMAKIANRLRSEPRPVPKKPISARILQAASATATSRGVDVRTGSMVPRQIGRKRANISTEDIETWTTAKRNKIRRIAEAKKRTPKANMISTVQHPGYSSAPGAPTAPAGVSAAGEAPSN